MEANCKNNRGVHFKPSTEQLNQQKQNQQKQQEQQQQAKEKKDPAQFVQTWQQRHSILSKLAPVLQTNNAGFGELLERAQDQLQHLNSSISSDQATSTQDKLLQRCLRTQIEPTKDLILLRKISDGQSGSVYLIRTRLSSLESLNQSNLYILKKVAKRISRKIQQYSSIETEQKILERSRIETGINKVKRTPLLHLSFQTAEELNIVIEYSPSGSITEHLSRTTTSLPEFELLKRWTIDVLSGIDWLHQHQAYCHRDIKPSNLIINHNDGHILLTDFATAAPLIPSSLQSSSRLIVPRKHRVVIVGTCDYIAPEVLQVHLSQSIATLSQSTRFNDHTELGSNETAGSYGPEIDYWSFGVTLFELVYGKLPFFCQSISDTYSKIVDHQSYLEIPEFRCRNIIGPGHDDEESDDDPSNHDSRQEEAVSKPLQSFLKALLCGRENRIGCHGSNGIEEVKKHEWFEGLNWEEVQRVPVPNFTRASIDINRLGDSVCLDGNEGQDEDDDQRFNFSAFFGSSPGLSALKMNESGADGDQSSGSSIDDDDEDDHEEIKCCGFTYLPSDPDEFNRAQEERQCRQKLKSSIKRTWAPAAPMGSEGRANMHDDRFSTPIKSGRNGRRGWSPGGSGVGRSTPSHQQVPQTGLGCRSIRLTTRPDGRTVKLSQIDQLIQLNKLVFSTAKKATPFSTQLHFKPLPPSLGRTAPSHNHLLVDDDHEDDEVQDDQEEEDQSPLDRQLHTATKSLADLSRRIDELIARSDAIILNAQPP
ncbi:hypothetical protein MJO28_007666 [Puccinia striiformis f. sp. tritici]|uniref:AGC/DMPK/GEK protein kinase n=3 Tax=Puccinia striiformis TaxID=27350 RepID=A0A0L0UYE2_9BASI|nr:hypothetical protein Pst134EA_013755 [Puccinia striiformis f. sp. tritici]KNE92030.1 AGC/DMPK/GEK protein kinase [Puccinia striiformis f. sp. tritici PST-78]POW09467.1 hypothetical protein PSTT_06858 [Puccinia striiformis]KAH9465895.1 hypothetical protein Pst134EA_013755 [Puccinia striiformis f. sp. tritici]KAI7951982.1 hypothetical protein MJO28_007666 [Puccinia striiformis f. sp. tritici]KAI7956206.1 hypothetical protein MJO29_007605 [Puccinia striiformis f. sp. tritici]